MNQETKDFVCSLLKKHISEDLPTSSDSFLSRDDSHIEAIYVVNELCEALGIYSDEEE